MILYRKNFGSKGYKIYFYMFNSVFRLQVDDALVHVFFFILFYESINEKNHVLLFLTQVLTLDGTPFKKRKGLQLY